MNKLHWNPYVFHQGEKDLLDFWGKHFNSDSQRKVLFIIGKGFDVRMNNILRLLVNDKFNIQIKCIIIDYPNSNDEKYLTYVNQNFKNFEDLISMGTNIEYDTIKYVIDTDNKENVGFSFAKDILKENIENYTDILIDISAIPRSLYFPLINALYYKTKKNKDINLFVLVSENVEIDKKIKEFSFDDNVTYPHGFRSAIDKQSNQSKIKIFYPLLGENKAIALQKIYNEINPDDTSPVIPFPSKNPRRTEDLLMEYHKDLRTKYMIERQNVLYGHERNPFELYQLLINSISSYEDTMDILNGCIFVIGILTSKLLSIGALLVGLEKNDIVSICNLSANEYKIDNFEELITLNYESEPFSMWILGEAYE